MTVAWEDVDARASGLATHLLPPETVAALAGLRTLPELARGLAGAGVLPEDMPAPTAAALELGARRWAAGQIEVLRRWLGTRAEVVAVALDGEDRRSLRALVRGAVAGASADARLAGLMPTPHLPERLLRDLAERSSVREQAALLVAAGHPSGPAVLASAAGTEPDLFEIELAIARAFAERAVRGARRGGSFLRAQVEDLIDAENSRTAVLLARGASARPAGTAFIPGGRRITAERFARAATAPSPEAAGTALAAVYDGEPEAKALRAHALDPARLDAEMERSLGGRLRRAARQDTLGPAPLLLYLHRLRQQLVALGEIIWVLDLGTTPAQPGLTAGGAVA